MVTDLWRVTVDTMSPLSPTPSKSAPEKTQTDQHQKAPHLVWLSQGLINSVALSPTLSEKPTKIKGSVYKGIVNVGLGEHGHFVGIKEDGSGRVVKLTSKGALKVIWEFNDSVSTLLSSHLDKLLLTRHRPHLIPIRLRFTLVAWTEMVYRISHVSFGPICSRYRILEILVNRVFS